MDFDSGAELLLKCKENGCTIAEIMIRREMTESEKDRTEILTRMQHAYEIMKAAAHEPLKQNVQTMGGLIGGEASRLYHHKEARTVCGTLLSRAVMYAMAVMEVNASMGLIVAAPTAGASGVLPGVLLALEEEYQFTTDEVVNALFTAGAVGYLFMRNASVSGAQAGCQAEVGVASAMAAAAAVELLGGSPKQCLDAAAIAIANMLGLVCDPIAGLVESPCQGRNAAGVGNAMICAELAMSGISQRIPFDEMAETMLHVGEKMSSDLRETALGGCAACKTGYEISKNIYGKS